MRGVDIDLLWKEQPKKVKIKKILNYEYEFWADIKHNRYKNGDADDAIFEKKIIDNPNKTLILTEEWPKIEVLYITKKRKRKDYGMGFCTKVLLLIEVDGLKHVIKVERLGPFSSKEPIDEKYKVIDYDLIYHGNPTVKPIFQF